jgi:two-component system, cell cycle sensor histidine kinase PleC
MSTEHESPAAAYARLLSLAVHELRTPASVVGGYLRMLQRDTDSALTDRQRKMIDEAEKSCARMVALIAEMSEVSKLDAGGVTLGRDRLDLFSLVQDVAKGVHEAAERDVRLEVRGEPSGGSILGDGARLTRALEAIFRAILREQPAACTVVVDRRVAKYDGVNSAVLVVAQDARVQAAYEATPSVFDEKRGGMGLALPLARRVIERHGGRIWAPQDAEERSAALVSIPLSE